MTVNRSAAVNLARDLALKLVERRAVAPDQLAAGLKLLTVAAENVLRETDDGHGLWLVRLARDCTLKMIERNLAATVEAAAVSLGENARLAVAVAARLDQALAPAALNAARDLSLKFLETGRVTKSAWPQLFEEVALAVGGNREQ
ncbi:MAG: hypothetical protein LBV79_05760 [Candidatus Adiutrix sp.]|jgi:hypothetical protein|nr:hypothetical protein [Candidatus Adiutrix sp.]